MPAGIIAHLWRYPVKSLGSEPLERADVDTDGLRGDRTSALVIQSDHARTGKPLRGKEHDRLHLCGDIEAGRDAAGARGFATEAHTGGRWFDAAAVSIIFDCWLDGLCAHVGYAVEPVRFRPNVFVAADPSFADDESSLVGAMINAGALRLRVLAPIKRCVVITYQPEGEPSDPRILRYIANERAALMGVYCAVERAGELRTGDALFVER